LSPVALEAMTLQPTAELNENGRIGSEFVKMHQF